ncbi:hypothetical protein ABK040_004732 [Willaertia magna]
MLTTYPTTCLTLLHSLTCSFWFLNDLRFRMDEEIKDKNNEIDRLKKLSENNKDELSQQLNKINDEKNDLQEKMKSRKRLKKS